MPRGGKRKGAGRPKGLGRYGEATKPIRIPMSRVEEVKAYLAKENTVLSLPLYGGYVRAGFPSPAEDYIESMLDLNEYLIKHPAATFIVRASGDSMEGAAICSGDLLIVDRSIEPAHNKIVIAAINDELTVKRLYKKNGVLQLLAENPNYPAITIDSEKSLIIWGVVTHIIHKA